MKEKVPLTKKEQSRLMVLNGVEVGRISAREAAEVLDFSLFVKASPIPRHCEPSIHGAECWVRNLGK
jgi:hypothetical protein